MCQWRDVQYKPLNIHTAPWDNIISWLISHFYWFIWSIDAYLWGILYSRELTTTKHDKSRNVYMMLGSMSFPVILCRYAMTRGLTPWHLVHLTVIVKVQFSNALYKIVHSSVAVKLLSTECYRAWLKRSPHRLRKYLSVVRHQAITLIQCWPRL